MKSCMKALCFLCILPLGNSGTTVFDTLLPLNYPLDGAPRGPHCVRAIWWAGGGASKGEVPSRGAVVVVDNL